MGVSNDVFADLRDAVGRHDDWPTDATVLEVVGAARRLVQTVAQRAEYVEFVRRTVTPTKEALAAVMGNHLT